jgi:hypothetical protein
MMAGGYQSAIKEINMSNTVQSAYEKMLENPDNRVSSSGMMKQPVPNGAETAGAAVVQENTKEDPQEAAYMAGIDARMKARATGQVNDTITSPNLETRLKEVEDLLVEVMKVHMKIIKKGLV